ncbi:MAG: DUF2752 domain-containing protein [Lewinellaceae bacterium]|nr:DUF2752 domain-containing protein [Saprospiraceae bacterium]MCB9338784.1 DUF2752 domain-containing protein [Lewinellaceae bacterium]
MMKVAVGFLVPACLWVLPAGFFDGGPPLCFSRLFFGRECLGCGTTRAMMNILHGHFVAAWALNPLGFVALPLIVFYWVKWVLKNLNEIKMRL